jgi:hypothetical protein
MSELGIEIEVAKKDFEISLNLMTTKIESQFFPQVWTKGKNFIFPNSYCPKSLQYKNAEKTIPHSPRGEIRSENHN